MSNQRILIVEDEPLIADDIALNLERQGYLVKDIVDNALDAIDRLEATGIDLILLDINIEGNRDGIWLANHIHKHFNLPFVFLTSYYDENTLKRAHETNPAGYIVKPFDEGDLVANVRLALLKHKQREQPQTDTFFIRDRGSLLAIQINEILYAQSDDNYATIYTKEKKYVVPHTLKSVEEKLKGSGFIRNHKSYLVNFQKITSISEGFLFLGNIKLPIGRSYKDELLKNLPIL